MRHRTWVGNRSGKRREAFTLIELLVVTAIIALLAAIAVPVLHRVMVLARRLACQSNLRQVTGAYERYAEEDNNGCFYEGTNHNFDYGGWNSPVGTPGPRPVNKHLALGASTALKADDAQIFRCREDTGQFSKYGNSYQANNVLVIRGCLWEELTGAQAWVGTCNAKINRQLPVTTMARVEGLSRSQLLWIGDWPWYSQWDPQEQSCQGSWHGSKPHWHNLSFLDGHVAFTRIIRGVYVDRAGAYRIQPFRELDTFLFDNQQEAGCSCGQP